MSYATRPTCALLLWVRGVVRASAQVGHHLLEDVGLRVRQAGSCRGVGRGLRWLPCLGACTHLLWIMSLRAMQLVQTSTSLC